MCHFDQLTRSQQEVIDLRTQHKTTAEVAQILGISPARVLQRAKEGAKRVGVPLHVLLQERFSYYITEGLEQ